MKILSLDTTMAACSAAVLDTDSALPLAASFVPMDRGHAEALPPMVAEVVSQSGIVLSDIERIAVTVGPGTFTGVRIGLAFARGMGLARRIPVIGIDSLSAIAANERARAPLLVVTDARNDEVYAAIYDADRKSVTGPYITTAAAAAAQLTSEAMVLGSASGAALAASGRRDLVLSTAGDLPVAAHFGRLCIERPAGPMPAPLYLRAPDAKPQSMPLRKISILSMEAVGAAASELLSRMHGEVFEDGWSARSFADMLASPGTEAVVASEGSVPLGFIVTRRAADEAEVITIGSLPAVQRRGVGRQVLERHMMDLSARGVRHLFLEVAASNTAARALYAACGFIEAGRRKGYYRRRDGFEDAVVMRRELRP